MMKLKLSNRGSSLIGGLAAALLCFGVALAAGELMPRSLVSSGGGRVSSTNLTLRSASGQPVAGVVSSGTTLCSGHVCGQGAGPTAVELVSFIATPLDTAILIAWETGSEVDTLGFYLYRSIAPNGDLLRLNETLIPAQSPGSPVGARYEYVDDTVEAGVPYWYWLEDVDVYGIAARHGPISATVQADIHRIWLPLVSH